MNYIDLFAGAGGLSEGTISKSEFCAAENIAEQLQNIEVHLVFGGLHTKLIFEFYGSN